MSVKDHRNDDVGLGRRGLLKGLGLVGLGALLPGGRRVSAAEAGGAGADEGLTTMLVSDEGSRATFTTGSFETFEIPAGARLGIGLIIPGGVDRRGRPTVIRQIATAHLAGLGDLAVDRGVAQGVYRMLDSLAVQRPVEIYGLSTVVKGGMAAGESVRLTWTADLRKSVNLEQVRQHLVGYHACVMGLVNEDSRFTGRMSYAEIGRVA